MVAVFEDPQARRVYYATMAPYDPATDAEVTVRIATAGVLTRPTDTPANTWFAGVLVQALRFERSMYSPGEIGGRALPDRGNLEIANHNGAYDDWLSYNWEGRSVEIRVGRFGDPYADSESLFVGTCGQLGFSRTRLTLPLRDKAEALDRWLQETLFAGAGGAEGGDDLKDKPKPVCLGDVKRIVPVEVDTATRLWQVHDGPIEAISAVYENGALKTAPTFYTADLANGQLTLAADPAGVITADVEGSKAGGVYVSSAADLMERVVTEYGDPPLSAGDLDAASFAALNAKTTAPLGIYLSIGQANMLDVLDRVAASVGAYYGFNRAGKFQVGRLEAPTGSPDLTLTEAEILEGGLTREAFGPPRWRTRVHYARNYTLQLPDALDPSATDAYRSFAAQEFRTVSAEDADVKEDGAGKAGHKAAVDPDPEPTLLRDEADAQDEADRRLALFSVPRDLWHVATKAAPYTIDLGQEVRLVHSRFGLAAGRDLIVVGIREDAQANVVALDLWG